MPVHTAIRPDDLGFSDEAAMLKQTARKLLARRLPLEQLHKHVAGTIDPTRECVFDRDLWTEVVELGWPAVAVPKACGGFGMPLCAMVGLLEEVGRVALPCPLVATFCATAVLRSCRAPSAHELLKKIVDGTPVSLAITNRHGSWDHEDTDVRVRASAGLLTLEGTAHYVQEAQKAEFFVVKAQAAEGVGLYIVDARAPGVRIVPDAIVDLTRDQGQVDFGGVTVPAHACIAKPGEGAKALAAAWPAMLLAVTADMVGAAEWQLQTTAEYARTRVQFDRPLGFFQAVKHPLVDMMLAIDEARSLLYDAAWAYDHAPEETDVCARMAKASASDMAAYCSGRSVQLHGGIGFTWECAVQLYFKRQKHNEVLFGDGSFQRAVLAEQLLGPIAAVAGAES